MFSKMKFQIKSEVPQRLCQRFTVLLVIPLYCFRCYILLCFYDERLFRNKYTGQALIKRSDFVIS